MNCMREEISTAKTSKKRKYFLRINHNFRRKNFICDHGIKTNESLRIRKTEKSISAMLKILPTRWLLGQQNALQNNLQIF